MCLQWFLKEQYCLVFSQEKFEGTKGVIKNRKLRTLGEHANHYITDEPMIYRTLGEHANHYITDAVQVV
jgi:hypothetical protein